jgi:hypothetical protein
MGSAGNCVGLHIAGSKRKRLKQVTLQGKV